MASTPQLESTLQGGIVAPIIPAQGQPASEQGGYSLARRRFQRGSLFVRGKERRVWIGRWREDVIEAGQVRRVYRSEVIGTLAEFPTRKLAMRQLETWLSTVNDPRYRARDRKSVV